MNWLLVLISSPVLVILLKWTLLLVLGWTVHWLLRHSHARWRLILWRSILCIGLVLPLAHAFPIPLLKIPIHDMNGATTGILGLLPSRPTGHAIPPKQSAPPSAPKLVAAAAAVRSVSSLPSRTFVEAVSWKSVLLLIWAVGCVCGAIRLIRLNIQLAGLRKEVSLASPALEKLVREIQAKLGIRRTVRIQISDSVNSPFVFGVLKPTILLPRTLAETLSPSEAAALLGHEIAHLRLHDLFWCVCWRWMSVICWFHPLVWKVPAAHNLACEHEADRVASGQVENRGLYAQLLAQLTLRALALPAVETKLTLNGNSQIAQRLLHPKQERERVWKWRHSATGYALAGVLFVMAAGCEFSKVRAPAPTPVAAPEFKKVRVVVEDQAGNPIEGATILPDGFRVQGPRRVDGYGWYPEVFGPAEKVTTDREGKAYVKYPVMAIPQEKLLTGQLIFSVSHPEFSTTRLQGFSVNGTDNPVRLIRGLSLEVSGYFGSDRQPVLELVPNLSGEGVGPEDWEKKGSGVFAFRVLSPGDHMLQLMGRLPSGEIVFSEGFAFTAEKGKQYHFALEMKPGIRLEGRIDDKAPRPVKNGRVLISVRPKEFPALPVIEDYYANFDKYGYFYFWHSYRPIAEDGTFVFESVPPGEVDVIVHGDGFVSQNGGQAKNRLPDHTLGPPTVIGVPQLFPLHAPLAKIEVATEPTATLEVTAKTKSGMPVDGAWVSLSPNVMRIQEGIFGRMEHSSEEAFRTLKPLPELPYQGVTDKSGKVVIRNLPAVAHGVGIHHAKFEAPLNDVHGLPNRFTPLKLSPGVTNKVEWTLQPKGTEFVGSAL
jgi:beta-lactamase regulating signal transducer with metallopeptidase domain